MATAKRKGAGMAILIGIGKKKPGAGVGGDDDSAEPSSPDLSGGDEDSGMDDKEGMAMDDLADCLGVPEDRRADFSTAFKAAVKAATQNDDMGGGGY